MGRKKGKGKGQQEKGKNDQAGGQSSQNDNPARSNSQASVPSATRDGDGSLSVQPDVVATPPTQQVAKKPPKKSKSTIESVIVKEFALQAEEDKVKISKHHSKESTEDSLVEFAKYFALHPTSPAHCFRPGFKNGQSGEKMRLKTNFFRLQLKGGVDVYQYDVSFLKSDESAAVKPEQEVGRKFKRITKRMNQDLLKQFVHTTGRDLFKGISYAYDNDRILITNKCLGPSKDGQIFRFEMDEPSDNGINHQVFLIRIMFIGQSSLTFDTNIKSVGGLDRNRALLQVLDIICKNDAFQNNIVYGSRIFFPSSPDNRRIPLEAQTHVPDVVQEEQRFLFELAFGYHQSTRLCQGGPMQNIDRAAAVLYRAGSLVDRMVSLIGRQFLESEGISQQECLALRDLHYVRFTTDYRGYTSTHTITSFTEKSCREMQFQIDGVVTTVSEYFRKRYGKKLLRPNLPCVRYNDKCIPVELCQIAPDQRYQRKLNENLLSIVSKHITSQKPAERSVEIHKNAQRIANSGNFGPFGVQLIPTQVEVDSRLISAPELKCGDMQTFIPYIGKWNMTGKKFVKPASLTKWATISFMSRKIDDSVQAEFVSSLRRTGQGLGMRIEKPVVQGSRVNNSERLSDWFCKCKTASVQLIVVFIPNNEYYEYVKSLGDKKIGVPTQVVLEKHFNPNVRERQKLFSPSFLSNLLLKINMKIGGSNLELSNRNRCTILGAKTMVVGIDVNHPSPGENSPSIAAVVGSIDSEFSRYHTEIRVNKSRDELVEVDKMVDPILAVYKNSRGFYPDHIIVYRDGVGEGQFAHVLTEEVLPLYEHLKKRGCLKLTYIVVQKRNNARFFPTNQNQTKPGQYTRAPPQNRNQKSYGNNASAGANKGNQLDNGNILPGTVIDTEVCNWRLFDFYLCSQNALLGTARPARYTVLWNTSPADADQLQMATYHLCYLFARSTSSIADPAPARYAHHAATRGKIYLKIKLKDGQIQLNSENASDVPITLNQALSINNNLQNFLFFI